jgi:CubicO group peptidase (beta-lactamase class C family)
MTNNQFILYFLSRLFVFSALVFAALLPLTAAAADNAAQGVQFAKPEQVGMSSERLASLDKFIQEKIDQKRVAGGVVLVARRGKIVHFKAYGMADIESGVKMRTDHMFRLYSQTNHEHGASHAV